VNRRTYLCGAAEERYGVDSLEWFFRLRVSFPRSVFLLSFLLVSAASAEAGGTLETSRSDPLKVGDRNGLVGGSAAESVGALGDEPGKGALRLRSCPSAASEVDGASSHHSGLLPSISSPIKAVAEWEAAATVSVAGGCPALGGRTRIRLRRTARSAAKRQISAPARAVSADRAFGALYRSSPRGA